MPLFECVCACLCPFWLSYIKLVGLLFCFLLLTELVSVSPYKVYFWVSVCLTDPSTSVGKDSFMRIEISSSLSLAAGELLTNAASIIFANRQIDSRLWKEHFLAHHIFDNQVIHPLLWIFLTMPVTTYCARSKRLRTTTDCRDNDNLKVLFNRFTFGISLQSCHFSIIIAYVGVKKKLRFGCFPSNWSRHNNTVRMCIIEQPKITDTTYKVPRVSNRVLIGLLD